MNARWQLTAVGQSAVKAVTLDGQARNGAGACQQAAAAEVLPPEIQSDWQERAGRQCRCQACCQNSR